MTFKDALLADFDHEMAVTRRLLDRVPQAGMSWRPHEKSWSLGGLATHLAVLPRWGSSILEHDRYDVIDDHRGPTAELTTHAEVIETFDRHHMQVRQRLVSMSEGELVTAWTLRKSGKILMSLPRASAFRSFLIHHLIHHRGQLSVYLRLQNVPLPPIYGATADELL